MSIAAIHSPGPNPLTTYFHQRNDDLRQLGQDLQSGNLSAAQQDFNSIQTLAQNGPLPNGEAFVLSWRQQDFANVGQGLQAGDTAGAKQAFAQLAATFGIRWSPTGTGAESSTGLSVSA